MPRTHGIDLKTGLFALFGCIVTVIILLVLIPRMNAIWGAGSDTSEENVRSLGQALGASAESVIRHRIIESSARPIWIHSLYTGKEETRIARSPDGDFLGAFSAVYPLDDFADHDRRDSVIRSVMERFTTETDGWKSAENSFNQVMDDSSGIWTFEIREEVGNTGITLLGSALSDIPHPSHSLLPWIFTYFVSLVLIILIIHALSRDVKELTSKPGYSRFHACFAGCCGAAASFCWLFPRFQPVVSIIIAIPFGIISGLLVLIGIIVRGKRLEKDQVNDPHIRSWFFGLAFLSLASVILILPGAAIGSLDRFASSPVPWLTAFLFAITLGIVSEWGVRPIIEYVLPERTGWYSLIIPAIVIAVWIPYSPTGLWYWDRLGMFLIAMGAGFTVRSVGMIPNSFIPYIWLLGLAILPGLSAGLGHAIPSAAFFIGGCIVPLVIGNRLTTSQKSDSDSPPAYILELEETVKQTFTAEFVGNIQSSLCRIDLPDKSNLQLGVAIKRSDTPTSAICRVFGLARKRMGIFLAEVPGGAMEAAVQAIDVLATVEAVATLKQNPATVMSEMQRLLRSIHRADGGLYRLNYSIIDERSNSVSIVSAGHSPVTIYRPLVKKFEQFAGNQPGILSDNQKREKREFEAESAQLISSDLVVFHSTGLLEESKSSRILSRKDICDIVGSHPTDSCTELAEKTQVLLDSFYADTNPPHDIITLFVRNG